MSQETTQETAQLPLFDESVSKVDPSPSDTTARAWQREQRLQRKRRKLIARSALHMEKWLISILLQEPTRGRQIYRLHQKGELLLLDFYRPINAAIFQAGMAAIQEQRAVTIYGVKKHLRDSGLTFFNSNYLEAMASVFIPPDLTVQHCLDALQARRALPRPEHADFEGSPQPNFQTPLQPDLPGTSEKVSIIRVAA
jgi:hypothetical protein